MQQPIPRIIIGCWQLAAGHSTLANQDRSSLIAILRQHFEAGFTAFDCADIYTGVEELLGEFRHSLHDSTTLSVDELRIHTKFVPDRDRLSTIDRQYVEQIIDRSLRRLRTEQLDLVQFHWWDYDVPGYVETAQHLDDLRTAGKIGEVGLTNFDAKRTAEILSAGVSLASNQVQWSLVDQRPAANFAQLAHEEGLQVFCYGALAGGFLTDRSLNAAEPAEPFANRSLVKYKLILDEAGGWSAFQQLLRALRDVADVHDCNIATIALAWVLRQPSVSAAIVGAGSSGAGRSGQHIAGLQKALQIKLTPEDQQTIFTALSAMSPVRGTIYEREREKSSAHAAIMRYNLNSDRQD